MTVSASAHSARSSRASTDSSGDTEIPFNPEFCRTPTLGGHPSPAGRTDERTGRLVQPDQGLGEDTDKQELAMDVGIDGAGASAEEAAMHITRGPDPDARDI